MIISFEPSVLVQYQRSWVWFWIATDWDIEQSQLCTALSEKAVKHLIDTGTWVRHRNYCFNPPKPAQKFSLRCQLCCNSSSRQYQTPISTLLWFCFQWGDSDEDATVLLLQSSRNMFAHEVGYRTLWELILTHVQCRVRSHSSVSQERQEGGQ